MPLSPGQRVGPYEIQALLGVGGMGEVYKGRDTRLGRDVALKVIAPALAHNESFRSRFENEARAASALNHPAIVTVYDVGETDSVAWIAMEWVEGRTLRQALAQGPLSVREAWAITRQLADGLAVAHAKGIVHRDLKPENVMITAGGRAKILDFGLARQTLVDMLEGSNATAETVAAAPRLTVDGTILGTVGYMSPEQAAGRLVDFRSDQFSLGLIAYEMLSGIQAFARGTAVETLSAIIRDDPVPLSTVRGGISDTFQGVIARCLAKMPEGRFPSTRDLAVTLEALEAESSAGLRASVVSGTARPGSMVPPAGRFRGWPLIMAVLGVVLASALGVIGWHRLAPSAPPAAGIDSLAVLPFENVTHDVSTGYLVDGLTESLIDQMSRLSSLKVMARATVFRFRGATDPQDVGRKLKVGAVLTGRVTRRGDRLTVSAELMDIVTGARLWGQTYDGPVADVLHVQESIASNISDGLRLELTTLQKKAIGELGTDSADAYQLMLKGKQLLEHDTEEDDLEARSLFLQALGRDPHFVEAHLGLASTYARSAGNGYALPSEGWNAAEKSFREVLALDPGNVRARAGLAGRRFMFDWDWSAAANEYRQLVEDPRLVLGPQFHSAAMYYWAIGRPEDSVTLVRKALNVDPGNIESQNMLGDFLAQAGRLDDAVAQYTLIAAAEPNDPRPLFPLADILKGRGRTAEAIETLRKAYGLAGEEEGATRLKGARTEAQYDSAQLAIARVQLSDLEDQAKTRYVSPLDVARLEARLGNREKALSGLTSSLKERSPGLVLLRVDRAWDRVRDDPRFAAVVQQVRIP
jgi:eukaryotic-like serine/threonine-protein kinase